jgi:hypothetical protein
MFAAGLERVQSLHQGWGWVVIIANGLAGLWALGGHWSTAIRSRALWWFIGAAQASMFVQVVLGAVLVGTYKVPLPTFHAFYGFVALIAIAIIYSYRAQMRHRLYVLYGLGSLFVMGLGIRAMLIATT